MVTNVSQLINSLVADRDLVFEFFFVFSRFEYALKRSPEFLKKQVRAEADWDEYGNSIKGRFEAVQEADFLAALKYLQKSPPGVQVVADGVLDWKQPSPGDGESTERYFLRLVQTVRNNLFHGGKYPYPTCVVPDVARNRDLLKACISVLNQCLILSPAVGDSFEEAA